MVTHQDKKQMTLIAQDLGNDTIELAETGTTTSNVLLSSPLPESVEGATEYVEATSTAQAEEEIIGKAGNLAEFYLTKKYKNAEVKGDIVCTATIAMKSTGNTAHLNDVIFNLFSVSNAGAKTLVGTKTVAVDATTTSTTLVDHIVAGVIEGIDDEFVADAPNEEDLMVEVTTTGKIATSGTVTHRLKFTNGSTDTVFKIPVTPGVVRDPSFFLGSLIGSSLSKWNRTATPASESDTTYAITPKTVGDGVRLKDSANAGYIDIFSTQVDSGTYLQMVNDAGERLVQVGDSGDTNIIIGPGIFGDAEPASSSVRNVIIGHGAYAAGNDPSFTTALGAGALALCTVASNNAFGDNAGGACTTGTGNTFQGNDSGIGVVLGSDNIMFGNGCGSWNSGDPDKTTLIGNGVAVFADATNADYAVIIGHGAATGKTLWDNAVIIGNEVGSLNWFEGTQQPTTTFGSRFNLETLTSGIGFEVVGDFDIMTTAKLWNNVVDEGGTPRDVFGISKNTAMSFHGELFHDSDPTFASSDVYSVASTGNIATFVNALRSDWGENGIDDKSLSTLTWTDTGPDRTLSIQPTGASFDYFHDGTRYTTTGDTRQITAVKGVHFVYYDGATLTSTANPTDTQIDALIREECLVSIIQLDPTGATEIYVGEERHGKVMDPVTHTYLHFKNGLAYIGGLAPVNIIIGDGSLATHAQFGIDEGNVSDEGLFLPVSAVAFGTGLPVYYMTGASGDWNREVNAGYSVIKTGTGGEDRLAYNEWTGSTWQLTEVGNNQFVLCHVFATTEKDKPMIAIVGQDTHATIPAARDAAETEIRSLILNDTLFPEFRAIASFIFQTSDSYGNTMNAKIVEVNVGGDDYVDWRVEDVSKTELSTSDHNSTTGKQGGLFPGEWYHLAAAEHTIATQAATASLDGYMSLAYAGKLDGIEALADVTGNNPPQAHKDSHDPNDGTDSLDTAAAAEVSVVVAAGVGTSHSFARADHVHAINHAITDNHILTVDDAGAADDEYCRFTANGIEGRAAADAFGDIKQAATTSATGVSELAIASEVNTGTDTTRVITCDALAGSNLGTKNIVLKVVADGADVPDAADGVMHVTIPIEMNGMDLVSVGAHTYTASDGGTAINIDIYNLTQTQDMLSTAITIDNTETDSSTAATPAVINAATDDVVTADVIRIDLNQIGANAAGLEIRMGFRLP